MSVTSFARSLELVTQPLILHRFTRVDENGTRATTTTTRTTNKTFLALFFFIFISTSQSATDANLPRVGARYARGTSNARPSAAHLGVVLTPNRVRAERAIPIGSRGASRYRTTRADGSRLSSREPRRTRVRVARSIGHFSLLCSSACASTFFCGFCEFG